MIYLDAAATTLIKPKRVRENVLWAMKHAASPGRGQYRASETAENIVFSCREKAANLFNVKNPENIVFTFNATHGLNIAINTLAYKGCRVVVSGYEHNAVMRPLRHLEADITIARSLMFDKLAAIHAFEKAIKQTTDLVVCTAMSNVFGYILPIYEIAEMCKSKNVPLIIDASQGAGVLNLDFEKLGAAFMAMPGHKGLYGPQGTGLLLCSGNIKPLICGGTGSNSARPLMPDYLPDAGEAGTHNVPGIAGLSAGIDFVTDKSPKRILEHEQSVLKRYVSELNKISGIEVFAADDPALQGGVLSLQLEEGVMNGFTQFLNNNEICVRTGLHCAPCAHETVGTKDFGTVRISFSAFSTIFEAEEFIKATRRFISRENNRP